MYSETFHYTSGSKLIESRKMKKREKVRKSRSIQALHEIYKQVPEFLNHQFVKTNQAVSSRNMIEITWKSDLNSAIILIDFAEKFKYIKQNAIQTAHYGQTSISILTFTIYHSKFSHMAIALNYEKHIKESILAYLEEIISKLSRTVQKIEIWSDNATSQFKNQCVMEDIKSFEEYLTKKIRSNFYTTMHGEPVVDGIGASAKRFVKDFLAHCSRLTGNFWKIFLLKSPLKWKSESFY